jgi:hypothetical protein
MLTLAPVVCALSLVAPAAKASEAVGVLAVSPPPGPTPELVEITERLRNELAKRIDGVIEARDLKERMTGQTSTATLAELDRAYAAAVEAGKRDYNRGMEWLRDIISEIEKQPESPEAFEQWTRANLRLARTRVEHASSPQEAEQAVAETRVILEQVVRAAPDLTLDPNLYPKKLVTLAEEAKATLRKAPVHKLVVKSSVEATRVFVDGRDVGLAPVTLKLTKGSYRVAGAQGAVRVPSAAVTLGDEDQTFTLDFSLATIYRANRGPGLAVTDPDQEGKVVRAASALGLDRVVTASFLEVQKVTFLVASLIQVKPYAQPLRQGWMRIGNASVPQSNFAALAEFLLTGQSSDLVAAKPPPEAKDAKHVAATAPVGLTAVGPGVTAQTEVRTSAPKPLLRWSPVATGVLAIGLGAFAAVEALSASSSYDKARKLLDTQGQLPSGVDPATYNGYVADGDSARTRALIGGVGAGVALAATGVLGYLSYKQTGEVGPFRF